MNFRESNKSKYELPLILKVGSYYRGTIRDDLAEDEKNLWPIFSPLMLAVGNKSLIFKCDKRNDALATIFLWYKRWKYLPSWLKNLELIED